MLETGGSELARADPGSPGQWRLKMTERVGGSHTINRHFLRIYVGVPAALGTTFALLVVTLLGSHVLTW